MREENIRYSVEDGWAYWGERCLDHADVENFRIFDERWASDGVRVYEGGVHKRKIDGVSFEYLNVIYCRDAKGVYTAAGPVKKARAAEFVVLDSGYRAGEWRFATQLQQGGYGRDSRSVYLYGVALPKADPSTWIPLGSGYSIDRERSYYGARLLEGVDPAQLSPCRLPTTGNYATDGKRFFNNDQVIQPAGFFEACEGVRLDMDAILENWWPGTAKQRAAGKKKAAAKPWRKKRRAR